MNPTELKPDFLSGLKLDSWYKACLYIGGVVLVVSFVVEVKGITNLQLQLLAGGSFFIGLGEWKNHKPVSWIKEANFWTGGPALMKGIVRKPDLVGRLFNLIGVILILLGIPPC